MAAFSCYVYQASSRSQLPWRCRIKTAWMLTFESD